MDGFDFSMLTDQLTPIILLVVGAAAGWGLKAVKNMIAKSSNKLDDAIWNKVVGEFTAVGVITPEQLKELHTMPASGEKPKT